MHYVYLLLLKNKNIYTGYTENLRHRVAQHKNGEVESTKHTRPLRLIHYEAYLLKEDAKRREKFLKSSDGKLFLRRQLAAFFKQIGRYEDFLDSNALTAEE